MRKILCRQKSSVNPSEIFQKNPDESFHESLRENPRKSLKKSLDESLHQLFMSGSSFHQRLLSALLICVLPLSAQCDDIEIYSSSAAQYKPNVLFLLDYSRSMELNSAGHPDDPSLTRIDVLQETMTEILQTHRNDFNFGVSFFTEYSTGIGWPISSPTVYANDVDPDLPRRDDLLSVDAMESLIDSTLVQWGTAHVAALEEASLYFRGEPVKNGGMASLGASLNTPPKWNETTEVFGWSSGTEYGANRMAYLPHDAHTETTWSGAEYVSPVQAECQSNHIILISDGLPTPSLSLHSSTTDFIGMPETDCEDLGQTILAERIDKFKAAGNCAKEIARSLYETDLMPDLPGHNNVKTHAVGFAVTDTGVEFLNAVADAGGGEYRTSTDGTNLLGVLDDIVSELDAGHQSFVAPAVEVDKATFANSDRLFFSLFEPTGGNAWKGNFKGYFFHNNNLVDINGQVATEDQNRYVINDTAQSFWSADADGGAVVEGGFNGRLEASLREIVTYTGGDAEGVGAQLVFPDDRYALLPDNADLTPAMFGVTTLEEKNALIEKLRQSVIGDTLHAKPVILDYGNRSVAFLITNQGLLHAIDVTDPTAVGQSTVTGGEELFAFMPAPLLANLEHYFAEDGGGDHVYGLDGQISVLHSDTDGNGTIDSGETALLVFGMRRGGNNYYAIEVSDPENPKYWYTIEGGSGDFSKLAQSWSRASLLNVRYGSSSKKVFVFGGGYDPVNDGQANIVEGRGSTVYFMDLFGNRLWEASHPDMKYSIPSDITALDTDQDGYADRLYVGDLGGQLWRIDFDDVATSSDYSVRKVAVLGGADSYQPFFYPPSVSLETGAGGKKLYVSVGSGDRSNPLNMSTTHGVFTVRDALERDADESVPVVTLADLYDATNNDLQSSDASVVTAAQAALDSARGWYFWFPAGEKALGKPLAFQGYLYLTTYSPTLLNHTSSSNHCDAQIIGGSKLYEVSIVDATAGPNLNSGTSTTRRDKTLEISGIAPSPSLYFEPGSTEVSMIVGTTEVASLENRVRQVYWYVNH